MSGSNRGANGVAVHALGADDDELALAHLVRRPVAVVIMLEAVADALDAAGSLKRITAPVSPYLEVTEIADRVTKAEGPALLFENVELVNGVLKMVGKSKPVEDE